MVVVVGGTVVVVVGSLAVALAMRGAIGFPVGLALVIPVATELLG